MSSAVACTSRGPVWRCRGYSLYPGSLPARAGRGGELIWQHGMPCAQPPLPRSVGRAGTSRGAFWSEWGASAACSRQTLAQAHLVEVRRYTGSLPLESLSTTHAPPNRGTRPRTLVLQTKRAAEDVPRLPLQRALGAAGAAAANKAAAGPRRLNGRFGGLPGPGAPCSHPSDANVLCRRPRRRRQAQPPRPPRPICHQRPPAPRPRPSRPSLQPP